jgi:phospholipase/lecithinase/hemolysin
MAMVSAIFLSLSLMAAHGSIFSALYVFGDSLSDTGRNPPQPPTSYYDGRYCNGPLWVEYLSADLGLPYNASNNFAVSGSTTADLMGQIAALPASPHLNTALFTVLSGGNDFFDNTALGVDDPAWGLVVTNAVDNLTLAVTTLYTNGAREIIVGNLADIGKVPAFNGTPTGYPQYIDSKVALFNRRLEVAMTNAMRQNPGLRIYLMDDNAGLNAVLSAPAAFGFTVTTNDALDDSSLADKSFNGPGANYVFWDRIHPTTKFDALTGAAAFAAVAVQLNLVTNGGNLNLKVNNLFPGLPYTIESSTNLTAWTTTQAFTSSATNFTMTVTNQGKGQVYYRVSY